MAVPLLVILWSMRVISVSCWSLKVVFSIGYIGSVFVISCSRYVSP